MSNWTHVAGIMWLDCIRAFGEDPDFDKVIGKECLWESPSSVWRDCESHAEDYLPMGSEGSLYKNVWINPCKSEIPSFAVSVFGDLRDHDSPDEIIDWFKEKCRSVEKFHCYVRNAVITAENEINGIRTWAYEEE